MSRNIRKTLDDRAYEYYTKSKNKVKNKFYIYILIKNKTLDYCMIYICVLLQSFIPPTLCNICTWKYYIYYLLYILYLAIVGGQAQVPQVQPCGFATLHRPRCTRHSHRPHLPHGAVCFLLGLTSGTQATLLDHVIQLPDLSII